MAALQDITHVERGRSTGGWFTIAILTIVFMYAAVDRQILSLLVAPIKADLGLSDTQISTLLGLSFALLYSLLNVPAGYLIDRFNRTGMIGGATVIWSGMTILCGFAGNFWQLFGARAGVGLGEAVVAPASYSLIRDVAPPERRSRAFGIFNTATYFGAATALIGGGALLSSAHNGAFDAIPVLNQLKPWQIVLIVFGAAGLPLSALLLLIREPARRGVNDRRNGTFRQAYAHFKSRQAAYLWLIGFVSLHAMLSLGATAWMPTIIYRKFALSTEAIGPVLGTIVLVFGPLGMIGGGMLMDRSNARGGDFRKLGFIGLSGSIIGVIATAMAPTLTVLWIATAITLVISGWFQIVGASTLAQITPSAHMGKATGLYFLFLNIVGQGLGPIFPAVLSDHVFRGPPDLPIAISVGLGGVGVLAGLCLRGLIHTLPHDLQADAE